MHILVTPQEESCSGRKQFAFKHRISLQGFESALYNSNIGLAATHYFRFLGSGEINKRILAWRMEDQTKQKSETNESPRSYMVPFGHVPYSPALPGAMGPLWDFPKEWWYYVGWAHDQSKSKHFTILVETLRITYGQLTASAIVYGIGTPSNQQFSSLWSAGFGFSPTPEPGKNIGLVIPPPTSTSWSLEAHTGIPSAMSMTCVLTSGTLGLSGATYKVDMIDATNGVSASFVLEDTFGMILEGASGAIGQHSYEFAMPSLNILGGIITLDGVKTELGGGNLWLDRQGISEKSRNQQSSHTESISRTSQLLSEQQVEAVLATHAASQLYIGNWLGVVMDDKTVYVLVFYWPKKQHQWIVGSELDPPVNPTSKIGLEYPSLSNWDLQSPVQGVNVLDSSEFDLNIKNPLDPSDSPHWTSPTNQQTYCSAWKLRIRNQVYIMTALVPGSEVNLAGTAFFEGAATISDDSGHQMGCAFVEQMGYTQ